MYTGNPLYEHMQYVLIRMFVYWARQNQKIGRAWYQLTPLSDICLRLSDSIPLSCVAVFFQFRFALPSAYLQALSDSYEVQSKLKNFFTIRELLEGMLSTLVLRIIYYPIYCLYYPSSIVVNSTSYLHH